jgi:metal-responsive CopG/Arc/MetJ family transcriptional regulator
MPTNGKEGITVSLDSDLIDTVDFLCGRRDINRSHAVKEALKIWCAVQFSSNHRFWQRIYYGVRNRSKQKEIF